MSPGAAVFLATITPPDLAEGVPLTAQMILSFAEPINPATVDTSSWRITDTRTGEPVSGSISVSGDARAATFTPAQPLRADTFYLVEAIGMGGKDGATLVMDPALAVPYPFRASFRTTGGDSMGPAREVDLAG